MEDLSTAATPNTEEPKRSMRLADLIDLYTRPRVFFSSKINLADRRFLFPIVLAMGISAQFDRVDTRILRGELDPDGPTWTFLEPLVAGSWGLMWLLMLVFGSISAVILFYLAGWWYRMRLKWSLAKDLDVETPRYLYAYTNFVIVLPHMLVMLWYTFAYPNYLAAYNSDELISLILPFLLFWSVATSYIAATTMFELNKWKARLWFLILPVSFYVLIMGLVVWIMTLFQ